MHPTRSGEHFYYSGHIIYILLLALGAIDNYQVINWQ